MHTDTPSHGPTVDLILFGAAAAVAFALTGGQAARAWVRLAVHGTPYGGHWHGIHRQ